MKLSERWLRTFVDPALDTQGLADRLTFGGIEVEGVERVAPIFSHVVVGHVVSVEKHPDADRLKVCQVDVGAETLNIVCGAPNVAVGMKVPAALVGAELPGITIKRAKVRGVESAGMLCSARELGISEDADGLLSLSADAVPGTPVRDVLELDDAVLVTKPTPNRGDCLSMRGIAREIAVLTGTSVRYPPTDPVEPGLADRIGVALDPGAGCGRYSGRLIRGVDVAVPTPEWMQRRLTRGGIRSISAVVDITNYVMLELGQPMHAFDAARLDGGVRVRRARPQERLKVLNGNELELSDRFLVIADDAKAVALAGIMGGADTGVTDDTRDVFLESAYFAPDVIAGKTRDLGFGSDSAFRFERGIDFALTPVALERATRLILDICGGRAGPVTEATDILPVRVPVELRLPRIARLLGASIPDHEVDSILQKLGCVVEGSGVTRRVTPPSWRFDISIEQDLIEEVARIHGYDRFDAVTPPSSGGMLPVPESQRTKSSIRALLVSRDYQEVVTYSFVDRSWEEDFCGNAAPYALANPIASQLSVMRSSLLGGLINAVAFNARHKQPRIRLFEVGRCFPGDAVGGGQPLRVGGAAYGGAMPLQWGSSERRVDFFDVKADVSALFHPRQPGFRADGHPAFHPGKSARIHCEGIDVGWIGELHPKWQQKYDLPSAPVLFELDSEALAKAILPAYQEISRFPPVIRDIALVFDDMVSHGDVMTALRGSSSTIVAGVELFDVYRGKDLGIGKKSLAFRVLLQDTRKTLTEVEVESAVAGLREILQERFNAKLR